MFKRILGFLAFTAMLIQPFGASAVMVVTDLQGSLIKASSAAVYFYGDDGKRYVFPSDKIFFSWYDDFSTVREITDAQLASIAIGGNVTYRPGSKLIKITTDPKVYAVGEGKKLRWIISENLAKSLYGTSWSKMVEDVSDTLFTNYEVGEPIEAENAYDPDGEMRTHQTLDAYLSGERVTASGSGEITLSKDGEKSFSWSAAGTSSMGYKLVWSKNQNPTYPTREGDSYEYYSSPSADSGEISGSLASGVTYYVRVCEYLGGRCGIYSNQVSIVGTDEADEEDEEEVADETSSDHVIVVKSAGSGKITWTDTETSSMGYKVVYSKNQNPTYPTREGDTYLYFSESGTRSATINDLKEGSTYYVRVCEYLGGKCGAYSNQISIVGASATEASSSDHVIVVKSAGSGKITWTDTETSSMGYKVVYSKNTMPTYPTREGDMYLYFSESDTRSATISDIEDGDTYYVRVCEYLGGKCGAYSNQISIVGE